MLGVAPPLPQSSLHLTSTPPGNRVNIFFTNIVLIDIF